MTKENDGIRAIAYVRVSTSRQADDGNSISNEYVRLDENGKITRVTHAIYDRQR